jgi:hypothetical protein
MSEPALRLSEIDHWGLHVGRCLRVLRRALDLLATNAVAEPLDENVLNRELYWCLLEAHRQLGSAAPPAPPIPEARNPPNSSDVERAVRENKIPDFQWGVFDDNAVDPRDSARHFVVECKCLFETRRSDWVYTEQYVVAGIRRFIDPGHGYGKGMDRGAMIGYVQQLTIAEALDRVNASARTHAVPMLAAGALRGADAADFEHDLQRPFHASPFHLHHLWIRVVRASAS